MTHSVPTPAERVAAALAEAGYPDAQVIDEGDGRIDIVVGYDGRQLIPDRVAWRAMRVARLDDVGCWDCWQRGRPCSHG